MKPRPFRAGRITEPSKPPVRGPELGRRDDRVAIGQGQQVLVAGNEVIGASGGEGRQQYAQSRSIVLNFPWPGIPATTQGALCSEKAPGCFVLVP